MLISVVDHNHYAPLSVPLTFDEGHKRSVERTLVGSIFLHHFLMPLTFEEGHKVSGKKDLLDLFIFLQGSQLIRMQLDVVTKHCKLNILIL